MKIGLIVAMTKELNLLLPMLEDHRTVTVNDRVYHTGLLAGRETIIQQCDIGKVNAAVSTLTMIDTFHPAIIINTGVAGGTGAAGILDVVIPRAVGYHDVWCGPGTEPGQASGCPAVFECPLPDALVDSLGVHRGILASGDIFVSTPEQVRHILTLYPDATAVDMESGAIAQVCHMKSVPFVAIRVISDTPGAADNISQYNNFWDDAPERTFNILTHLLKAL